MLDEINDRQADSLLNFHLYGELSNDMPSSMVAALKNNKNVIFHGYVKGADNIYGNLHAVMHLSRVEALGRIFFESVNYKLPFIGINAAGIGEIAHQYEYNDLIVKNGTEKEIAQDLLNALTRLLNNYNAYRDCIVKMKSKMEANMSVKNYCGQIDEILTDF
jgi:glycosyltransferase involved in cell wall biosynthesis